MIKYLAVAWALKLFSISSHTKKLYRFLGNTVGARKRAKAGLPESYIDRARSLLGIFQKYNMAHEGAKLLELGTGWVHWESTAIRLFYNAKITLFDVWDNREFPAFKVYFSEFLNAFDNEIKIPPSMREPARKLLETIISLNSFSQVYELLGFQYVVEPTGTLRNLEHNAYDACFSCNVFEHIDSAIVSDYIKELYHLLKPGGYSFITIDISDHLANYDPGVCRKNYLKYSDAVWKLCFENYVQYFNRIQRDEWLSMFNQAGFELLEEESVSQPIRARINKKYECLDRKDIECTTLSIVHRRPLETA
jgi:SAM-dependent methyltransferase